MQGDHLKQKNHQQEHYKNAKNAVPNIQCSTKYTVAYVTRAKRTWAYSMLSWKCVQQATQIFPYYIHNFKWGKEPWMLDLGGFKLISGRGQICKHRVWKWFSGWEMVFIWFGFRFPNFSKSHCIWILVLKYILRE
jgi:hypothetical protein